MIFQLYWIIYLCSIYHYRYKIKNIKDISLINQKEEQISYFLRYKTAHFILYCQCKSCAWQWKRMSIGYRCSRYAPPAAQWISYEQPTHSSNEQGINMANTHKRKQWVGQLWRSISHTNTINYDVKSFFLLKCSLKSVLDKKFGAFWYKEVFFF